MTTQLIYLACPYTHSDPLIMQQRFEALNKIAAQLMQNGLFIISPISHSHPIALAGTLPVGWQYWEQYDRQLLQACSKLIVAMLDGWSISIGVLTEIQIAKELNIPIEYLEVTA